MKINISLLPFACLAGFGVVACIVLHVCSLLGVLDLPSSITKWLHTNLGIVCLVAIIIGNRYKQVDGFKGLWLIVWRGCPLWMRRLPFCLGAKPSFTHDIAT